jgi:transcriptional regulator with XRE-family HTH domain
METNGNHLSSDFAHEFGEALDAFLTERGISQVDAARRMGLVDDKSDKKQRSRAKSRINSYCTAPKSGRRRSPDAQILCLACVRLGFKFSYNGYLISAESFKAVGASLREQGEQLKFEFVRQFRLTNGEGTLSVSVKRPPGRINLSVSLAAAKV